MAHGQRKPSLAIAEDLLCGDPDGLRALRQTVVQDVLEAGIIEAAATAYGAAPGAADVAQPRPDPPAWDPPSRGRPACPPLTGERSIEQS